MDITLISSEIALKAKWDVLKETGNSDHFPTVCYIINHQNENTTNRRVRRKKNIQWNTYTEKVEAKFHDQIKTYQEMQDIILEVAEEVMPYEEIKQKPGLKSIPCWDEECNGF